MSEGDPNNPVDLSPTGAREYADRIAAAKSPGPPLGGAVMPHIPRLDQPPPGAPRDRSRGVQQGAAQQGATQDQIRRDSMDKAVATQPNMGQAMSPQQYQQGVHGPPAVLKQLN